MSENSILGKKNARRPYRRV